MYRFWGVFRYEYCMAIKRWGFWLACLLINIVIFVNIFSFDQSDIQLLSDPLQIWQTAGRNAYWLNFFLPVVAGITIADRLVRDRQLKIAELFNSTPLSRSSYLTGKFLAALFSALTPVLVILLLEDICFLARGVPLTFVWTSLLAFLAINVPAFAFLTAFSLACPVILPVRVYQVLFTGYWFWGNFLNPDVFPTLHGTLLTASGQFALAGFFHGASELQSYLVPQARIDALANIAVLGICIFLVMVLLNQFLAWQSRRM